MQVEQLAELEGMTEWGCMGIGDFPVLSEMRIRRNVADPNYHLHRARA